MATKNQSDEKLTNKNAIAEETKTMTAKAGKRSKKVIEQENQKVKKEINKDSKKNKESEKSQKPNPRKIHLSKNQKKARELIERERFYSVKEAFELLPKISKVKFDATAELHVALNIDPKQSDQILRASASLPSGTGKKVAIAVIANEEQAAKAKKAGANRVDSEKIISEIQKGKLEFDILIASPDKMSELGKLAKILGPKGLMPSPKNGTVTTDIAKSVDEINKGKVELKNDPSGIMHVAFGKMSFKPEDLEANFHSIIKSLKANKPNAVKGSYIKSIYISSSMSPSIKLDITDATK